MECRRPDLNTTLDNGKELIHDSILDDSERGQVKDDVDQLERQLSDIEKRMADEQGRSVELPVIAGLIRGLYNAINNLSGKVATRGGLTRWSQRVVTQGGHTRWLHEVVT